VKIEVDFNKKKMFFFKKNVTKNFVKKGKNPVLKNTCNFFI